MWVVAFSISGGTLWCVDADGVRFEASVADLLDGRVRFLTPRGITVYHTKDESRPAA